MSTIIYKHQKECAVIVTILFIISLIPIFLIAGFDAAAGDDYNYGALPHLAFLSSGSVWQAICSAFDETIHTWYTWQGTWFDCFLFCLHPEVFSDSAYVIVPYIFVILQVGAILFFCHHFIATKWQIHGCYWQIISMLYLLFFFQLVPSQKSAFFWWVGAIHYSLPLCLSLIGLVHCDLFLSNHRVKDYIILCIIATLIGGSTYPAALLYLIGAFLLWLEKQIIKKQNNKKDFFLLIAMSLEMIGLVVSIIAPGNATRSASDLSHGAIPSGGIIKTIIQSILFSVQDGLYYFIAQKTFILIEFILTGIVTWAVLGNLLANCNKDTFELYHKQFSKPGLFVLVMFLLNASMYSPRLYAGGLVSSGYFNFNFCIFSMCITSCIIYVEGWILSSYKRIKFPKLVLYAIISFSIITIVVLGRHGIKKYTDYVCLEYYLSGQATDYKEQIALQRQLMNEPGIDEVILPEINHEQGPLMHMPVVSDPENIDNYMTSKFYGKKSCRSIPRNQWIMEYGASYGCK